MFVLMFGGHLRCADGVHETVHSQFGIQYQFYNNLLKLSLFDYTLVSEFILLKVYTWSSSGKLSLVPRAQVSLHFNAPYPATRIEADEYFMLLPLLLLMLLPLLLHLLLRY